MYIFVLCYVLLCVYLWGIQENIILGEPKPQRPYGIDVFSILMEM